jgi:hypothetical protein
MAGTTLVNQVPYDFQSIETELVANGESFGIIEGLDQFDYTVTINRTKIYGRSRLPILRTEGDAEFDASITIHRFWWDWIRQKSKDLGVPLASLEMILAFSFWAPSTKTLHTDTITGVKFKEIKNQGQKGPDPQMTNTPLDIMNIYFDGEDIFGNKL